MDETTITGTLPNLTIQVSHRADPENGAEMMTIQLRATPDFQAALPLLGSLAGTGAGPFSLMGALGDPLAWWTQMAQAWMAPWALLAQANPLTGIGGNLRG